MSEKSIRSTTEKFIEIAGNMLPILTVVFFAAYYYFTSKFADLEKFNQLESKVVVIERDISLLQKEDITSQSKLNLIDEVEERLRECERKLNLLINREDRPIPSETTLELKGEITVLKMMIENLREELKSSKP